MDSLTPEEIISIAAGVIGAFAGLVLLTFYLLWPREFAVLFGCKLRSSPKPKRGRYVRRASDKTADTEYYRNPIVIGRAKVADVVPVTPLKVQRTRKEFTATPVVVVK